MVQFQEEPSLLLALTSMKSLPQALRLLKLDFKPKNKHLTLKFTTLVTVETKIVAFKVKVLNSEELPMNLVRENGSAPKVSTKMD